MDELFSCRNCIHNSGQTLNIGRGVGFCLQHDSVIWDSSRTTCKYHFRGDLPWFVVDEARNEHAAEFARFSGLVDLYKKENIDRIFYSERFTWERSQFDSVTNALARYHQSAKKWIFIEAFSGGVDGRRSVARSCLTRRYMSICNTWRSSFRLTLDIVSQLAVKPEFVPSDVCEERGGPEEALWDVVFSKLSLVQEYGWHDGLTDLQWITDSIDSLTELNWEPIRAQLEQAIPKILGLMFEHAKENRGYFERAPVAPEDFETDTLGDY